MVWSGRTAGGDSSTIASAIAVANPASVRPRHTPRLAHSDGADGFGPAPALYARQDPGPYMSGWRYRRDALGERQQARFPGGDGVGDHAVDGDEPGKTGAGTRRQRAEHVLGGQRVGAFGCVVVHRWQAVSARRRRRRGTP